MDNVPKPGKLNVRASNERGCEDIENTPNDYDEKTYRYLLKVNVEEKTYLGDCPVPIVSCLPNSGWRGLKAPDKKKFLAHLSKYHLDFCERVKAGIRPSRSERLVPFTSIWQEVEEEKLVSIIAGSKTLSNAFKKHGTDPRIVKCVYEQYNVWGYRFFLSGQLVPFKIDL